MWRKLRSAALIAVLTVVFAAGLKSCIVDAFRIPSASMSETLIPGDFLLVNKFIYGAKTPSSIFSLHIPSFRFPSVEKIHRGSVLVFEFPGEPDEVTPFRTQVLVKRCAGIPSDTLQITKGRLLINGSTAAFFSNAFDQDFTRTVVPFKGMNIPLDTAVIDRWKTLIRREGHTVERYDGKIFIDGIASTRYHVENNYYFAIGDNVNNSYDSRYWGFIPEENIVGQAVMIYWSKDHDGIRWRRIGTLIR
jgi:signal peptidase I